MTEHHPDPDPVWARYPHTVRHALSTPWVARVGGFLSVPALRAITVVAVALVASVISMMVVRVNSGAYPVTPDTWQSSFAPGPSTQPGHPTDPAAVAASIGSRVHS